MIVPKDGVDGKVCSSCRRWKPLPDFFVDRSHGASQGGRHCKCKVCYREGRERQRAVKRA